VSSSSHSSSNCYGSSGFGRLKEQVWEFLYNASVRLWDLLLLLLLLCFC